MITLRTHQSRYFFIVFLLACAVTAGIVLYIPPLFQSSVLLGILALLVLVGPAVFVVYWCAGRSADRIAASVSRITVTSRAICEGAVDMRITSSEKEDFAETLRAYTAVNKLADKSNKDLEEMRRLERVRSEFLANVSHELRTPIFSIQGFLETLLDGALDDEEVRRQFVEKAYSNTVRLNSLLTDLINISRIESGEMRFSFRYFPLIPLVREITRNLEAQAQGKNVTITVHEPEEDDVEVYGDRDRLAQVLTNLIENAIKYNVDKGTVDVWLKPGETEILVQIQDMGIGIPPEHHKRIFERFYRVDKNRSRSVGGTGLGLAIVKHILEAHKSALHLKSEPGKGTTISFTLKTD